MHSGGGELPPKVWVLPTKVDLDIQSDNRVLNVTRAKIKAVCAKYGWSWEELYKVTDANSSGSIDFTEFTWLVRHTLRLNQHCISDREVEMLFAVADKDGQGDLDVEELVDFIRCGAKTEEERDNAEKVRLARLCRNLHMAFQALPAAQLNPRKLFAYLDVDGDRRVSKSEFVSFVRSLIGGSKWNLRTSTIAALYKQLDIDHDGVDLMDLVRWCAELRKESSGLPDPWLPQQPLNLPKLERRKTFKQTLQEANDLEMRRSSSFPSLHTSSFTSLGRTRPPIIRMA